MFAVVKTGGKQYRLTVGEKLKIEQIAAEPGQVVALPEVLAVGSGEAIVLGTPVVAGAAVHVTVLRHGRSDKVRIFKMRRRKHYQKHQGHRQWFTEIFISEISHAAQTAKAEVPAALLATSQVDSLTMIDGITPMIARLLAGSGVTTFAQLADESLVRIGTTLKAAGSRHANANPASWAEQAALARDGKMDALKKLQESLNH
jgi:large subunit ribosomal protein L21